jgi:hypothetical protein
VSVERKDYLNLNLSKKLMLFKYRTMVVYHNTFKQRIYFKSDFVKNSVPRMMMMKLKLNVGPSALSGTKCSFRCRVRTPDMSPVMSLKS